MKINSTNFKKKYLNVKIKKKLLRQVQAVESSLLLKIESWKIQATENCKWKSLNVWSVY